MARAARLPGIMPVLLFVSTIAFSPVCSFGGTLTVVTDPPRAEVWIDNNYAGLSPVSGKRLPAGSYTIRLVDPARQVNASEMVVLESGAHLRFVRTLSDRYGKLRVDTDPPGAEVTFVARMGKTPLANDFINPGAYTVEIKPPRPKYLPITEEIVFAPDGQPITISKKLEKTPLLTKKRGVQLILGTVSAAGFTWAIAEHGIASSARQKAAFLRDVNPDGSDEMDKRSKNAGVRRNIAIVGAGLCAVGLQVTVFIW